MRIEENNSIVFDSLAELHEHMTKNPSHVRSVGGDSREANVFYNFTTPEQAVQMLATGDQSQVENAKRLSDKFSVSIDTHGSMMGNGVAGFAPCVPEYLGGSPESMYAMLDCESSQSPLKIIVDPTSSAGVSAETLQKRGAIILAAAMALSATRPIQLEICACLDAGKNFRKPDGTNFSCIRIGINSTPLDLGSACYALSNPAFARRICYGVVANVFDSPLMWASVPGIDMTDTRNPETTKATLRLLGEDPEQCLFIPAICLNDELVDAPEKWISETLAKYGQPAIA